MSNNEKNSLNCDIVCDLLELYHDKIVSDTTERAVSEHLCECESCKAEYEKLDSKIPKVSEISTRKEFSKMMMKKKIKHIIIISVACIISCLILAGTFYTLTCVNLSDIDDITVHRVYRYDTDAGEKFFVLYSTKNMSKHTYSNEVIQKDGKTIFEISYKRPVIAKDFDDAEFHVASFGAEKLSVDGKIIEADCDELCFGGNIVWTKENSSDDEIPGYVYGYMDFENGNMDEFGNSDEVSFHLNIDPDNIDSPENYIGVGYSGKGAVRWNLDGEVIYDSTETIENAQ